MSQEKNEKLGFSKKSSGVVLKDVTKIFQQPDTGKDFVAVDHINLEIKDGEMVTLLGPSGCGKTTTLRMISGFEYPTSGNVFIGDRDVAKIPPNKRGISMVFQSYALFPHLNIWENIAYGLRVAKIPQDEIIRRTNDVVELMQLKGMEKRFPNQLSGGQQQRVALARALCIEPDVLLFDEPLSNLDAKLRVEMRTVIKNIQHSVNITTVYVTHDQEEAMAVSDRIAVMNAGVIQHVGTPKNIYQRPTNLFVSTFIGRSNVLRGEKLVVEDGRTYVVTKSGYKAEFTNVLPEEKKDQEVILSVRPEEFLLNQNPSTEGITATVDDCVFLGLNTHYFVHLESGEEVEIIQESSIDSIIQPGTQIKLTLNTSKVNVFSADGSKNILTGVCNDCPN